MLMIRGLSYELSGKQILQDLHFEVSQGEFLAVLGPNGSGKSTLLDRIAERESPQSCALLRYSAVPWVTLKVQEYVELGRYPYHSVESPYQSQKMAAEALIFVSGESLKNQEVHTLSSGEFQRISFARALAQLGLPGNINSGDNEFKILLLDELLAHLDPFYQIYFLDCLSELCRHKSQKNIGVLCVMHDLNWAVQYANKFLLIKEGKVNHFGDQSVMTEENLSALFNIKIGGFSGKKSERF